MDTAAPVSPRSPRSPAKTKTHLLFIWLFWHDTFFPINDYGPYFNDLSQGWANFLAQGPHWVLKIWQRAGPVADYEAQSHESAYLYHKFYFSCHLYAKKVLFLFFPCMLHTVNPLVRIRGVECVPITRHKVHIICTRKHTVHYKYNSWYSHFHKIGLSKQTTLWQCLCEIQQLRDDILTINFFMLDIPHLACYVLMLIFKDVR